MSTGGQDTMTSHEESVPMQSNGAETKSVNVNIKGTVQGVFYRNWTVENAKKLDLKGWVRNCRDGSVEAVFSGPSSAVDDMIEKSHSGPSSAKVSGVTVNKWDNEIPEGFEQRPTSWAQSKQGDTVALLYSSGTTGTSKGVVLTHRNFIAASCIFNHGFDERRSPEDTLLLVLPMFHVYGLAICTITSLAKGMTVVVLPKFDFVKMLDACQTYKVTNIPLVPPIIIALTKLDVVLKYDLSALVQIGSGAAPLGRDILVECAKRFPN